MVQAECSFDSFGLRCMTPHSCAPLLKERALNVFVHHCATHHTQEMMHHTQTEMVVVRHYEHMFSAFHVFRVFRVVRVSFGE